MLAAYSADGLHLGEGIEGTVLSRMGDIYHAGWHDVGPVGVGVVSGDVVVHLLSRYLTLGGGQGEHLVAGKLYGSRLMDGYVSAVGTQHSLKAAQEEVNHYHVGLCAAAKKLYLGIGTLTEMPHSLACRLADGVGTVAWE